MKIDGVRLKLAGEPVKVVKEASGWHVDASGTLFLVKEIEVLGLAPNGEPIRSKEGLLFAGYAAGQWERVEIDHLDNAEDKIVRANMGQLKGLKLN